jgi:hypothetical protein
MKVPSAAARLQMLQDLYENGFLCECAEIERIEVESDSYGSKLFFEQIKHDPNCDGKQKLRELMGFPAHHKP